MGTNHHADFYVFMTLIPLLALSMNSSPIFLALAEALFGLNILQLSLYSSIQLTGIK